MTTPLCPSSFTKCSYPRLKHKRINCEQIAKHLSIEGAYVPHTHQQPNCGCNLRIAIPKVTILVCNWYSVCTPVWKLHSLMHKPSLLMHWTPTWHQNLALQECKNAKMIWYTRLQVTSFQHCKNINRKPPRSSSWHSILGFAKLKPNWRNPGGEPGVWRSHSSLVCVDALRMSPVIDDLIYYEQTLLNSLQSSANIRIIPLASWT